MVNENPPIEEQKDKEQNWDSIRKSLSFFSDEEFEQWKSFNEEQEKGNITPEEHQKNLEELQKKSVERRNKEQEEQNKKDKTTKEELDKAKTQSEKEKQEKLNKKKEELNNPDTPKETNQPIPVKISDTTKTPKEITSEKTPSKSGGEGEETKKERDKETEKKSGSLGLFGWLATIPGAIADGTKGRASSKNYAKNFFWFAAFPTTIVTRSAQLGLNVVGDTFRGIFTPKSRKRPWKVDWKQKYAKTSETRKTLRHTNQKNPDGGK